MRDRRDHPEVWDETFCPRASGRGGLGGHALMTVAAATSLAAETNQRPSREVRSSTPLLRTGLHSVRGHHTEPRKTCSRVGGICNSATMKRGFVQPCAGQNSEFTARKRRPAIDLLLTCICVVRLHDDVRPVQRLCLTMATPWQPFSGSLGACA